MDKVEIKNWDDLNLKNELLRGIYGYGFEKPSEIQKKLFTPLLINKMLLHKLSLVLEKQVHSLLLHCRWLIQKAQPVKSLLLLPLVNWQFKPTMSYHRLDYILKT